MLGKCHTHLLSQPCPALRRGRGTPHREMGWERKVPRLGVHPWWVRPNGCLGRALPELQAGQEQGGPPGFPDPVRLSGVVPSQAHLGSADAPHP